MSKYHYILDAGHGGIIDGEYQTSTYWWKRAYYKGGKLLSPSKGVEWLEANCDEKFYEGVFNREIRDLLSEMLMNENISHSYINDTEKDMPLSTRAYHANLIAAEKPKKSIFLSIHSNAGGGTGNEIYTSKGYTRADPIGQIFAEELFTQFEEEAARKDLRDGDFDKEADFYVLKYTAMPAVLTENFFYDNYYDFKLISNPGVKQQVAEAHFRAIKRIEKEIKL